MISYGRNVYPVNGSYCISLSKVNNTSEGPKNVSDTLVDMENLANPNETKTEGINTKAEDKETKTEGNETNSMNATSTDGDANGNAAAAASVSSNRVVMQPESVANNLFQRVSNTLIHECRGASLQ